MKIGDYVEFYNPYANGKLIGRIEYSSHQWPTGDDVLHIKIISNVPYIDHLLEVPSYAARLVSEEEMFLLRTSI